MTTSVRAELKKAMLENLAETCKKLRLTIHEHEGESNFACVDYSDIDYPVAYVVKIEVVR